MNVQDKRLILAINSQTVQSVFFYFFRLLLYKGVWHVLAACPWVVLLLFKFTSRVLKQHSKYLRASQMLVCTLYRAQMNCVFQR
jgi:hypothetical protein